MGSLQRSRLSSSQGDRGKRAAADMTGNFKVEVTAIAQALIGVVLLVEGVGGRNRGDRG